MSTEIRQEIKALHITRGWSVRRIARHMLMTARPFICCAHCYHEDGYVHDSGCEDTFCTGYDERTPSGNTGRRK